MLLKHLQLGNEGTTFRGRGYIKWNGQKETIQVLELTEFVNVTHQKTTIKEDMLDISSILEEPESTPDKTPKANT